ncbi:MAG TPA: TadE family protein [Methylomirabilota bacterium]|nr:TadE family protein [Methylomirabilota bacterium]
MSSIARLIGSKKGQALIELTLVFPLMLTLIYGAVEVGSVISTYLAITHTTREGANLTSRGTDPNVALDAIITASAPTIRNNNQGQWRVIYSRITQKPGIPCPPKPCIYRIESQIIRGNFAQTSEIGTVNQDITISGIQDVDPGQTFHAIEVFYDYTPNVMTYVGSQLINTTFYDRSIFTNVSNS